MVAEPPVATDEPEEDEPGCWRVGCAIIAVIGMLGSIVRALQWIYEQIQTFI